MLVLSGTSLDLFCPPKDQMSCPISAVLRLEDSLLAVFLLMTIDLAQKGGPLCEKKPIRVGVSPVPDKPTCADAGFSRPADTGDTLGHRLLTHRIFQQVTTLRTSKNHIALKMGGF